MSRTAVIIVAGGSGTRMGAEMPKQFLRVAGKPLLMHTVARFAAALPEAGLIVVLPENQRTHWAALCEEYHFAVAHTVVTGGNTRFDSVKNALAETAGFDYIGVHDGVRPVVTAALIDRVLEAAQNFGAAIPVIPVADSLREVVFCGECQDMSEVIDSRSIDRSRFVAVQTPQFFRDPMLRKAYEQGYVPEFTDDAAVVEAAGHTVTLVPGEPENLKVTTPADLDIAEVRIKNLSSRA